MGLTIRPRVIAVFALTLCLASGCMSGVNGKPAGETPAGATAAGAPATPAAPIPVAITVDRVGPVLLRGKDLTGVLSLKDFPAAKLTIRLDRIDGPIQPIWRRCADPSRLAREDEIVFLVDRLDDSHTGTRTVWLTADEGSPEMEIEVSEQAQEGVPVVERWPRSVTFEEDRLFTPLRNDQLALADLPCTPWVWGEIKKDSAFEFEIDPPAPGDAPAKISLTIQPARIADVPHKIAVGLNGTAIGSYEWKGPQIQIAVLTFSSSLLRPDKNTLTVTTDEEPSPVKAGAITYAKTPPGFVDRFQLEYEATGPGHDFWAFADAFATTDQPATAIAGFSGPDVWGFNWVGKSRTPGACIPDATGRTWTRIFPGVSLQGVTVFNVQHAGIWVPDCWAPQYRAVCCTPHSAIRPLRVRSLEASTEAIRAALASQFVILVPAAWADAVEPLAAKRRAEGLTVGVVPCQAIHAFGTDGPGGCPDLRNLLRLAYKLSSGKLRYVLICADATRDRDTLKPALVTVPIHLFDAVTPGICGTDQYAACMDDEDTIPDIAIGRASCEKKFELAAMVKKWIDYDVQRPGGLWRKRISLAFGTGQHGAQQDQVISTGATTMVAGMIPRAFDFDAVSTPQLPTPYTCLPTKMNDLLLSRFNAGCVLFAYAGHGWTERLEQLNWQGKKYPILGKEHIPNLKIGDARPMGVFFACNTGQFDDPDHVCLAEALVRAPNGFLAVLACAGLSHPYSDGVFAKELMGVVFKHPDWRLGDMIREARRRILVPAKPDGARMLIDAQSLPFLKDPALMARLRKDEVWLYGLFGDPTLRLALPEGTIELDLPKEARAGTRFNFSGRVKGWPGPIGRGPAVVTLECERLYFLEKQTPFKLDAPDVTEVIEKNFAIANRIVLYTNTATLGPDGAFETSLVVPDDLPTHRFVVKAYAQEGGRVAAGDGEIQVYAK